MLRNFVKLNPKCHGLTLIELLIATVLGIIVLGTIITVFATTVRYNADNLQMIRLNQELRGAMSLISRDLRRAGYFNSATVNTTYLDTFGGNDTDTYGFDDCIYFAYDIDSDGTIEESDYVAFRLKVDEIQIGIKEVGTDIDCDDSGDNIDWQEAITKYNDDDDRFGIKVTRLEFEPECSIAGGIVYPGDFTCAGGVEVRNITITITGQVTTPVDGTVVSRTLTETIKLRNDSGV